MKWKMKQPATGDMIRVRVGSMYHYGIYLSDDEVIQFGLPPIDGAVRNSEDVKVLVTDVDVFHCGNFLETAELGFFEKRKARKAEEIAAYARSRIGSGDYDILKNNCEHFAYECVFGKGRSIQSENAENMLQNILRDKK